MCGGYFPTPLSGSHITCYDQWNVGGSVTSGELSSQTQIKDILFSSVKDKDWHNFKPCLNNMHKILLFKVKSAVVHFWT